ncbi:MAG: hypothetical protein IJ335_03210 [Lachnospiraceae bacterium]|nr:hypothetical protein [Lachnospiraceae bacterium]
MRRRKKQITALQMILVGLVGVILCALVLLLIFYADRLRSFRPAEATFQYVAGTLLEYSEDTVYRSEDGILKIDDGAGENETHGNPILYKNENKMTLTENMLLMQPSERTGAQRVNCFTTISERGGLCTLTLENRFTEIYGGFLFNGEDTYVFLEEVTLEFANNQIVLAPLSYAIVGYQQYVEFYNTADGEYHLVALDQVDVTATFKRGYSLDMGKDTIHTKEGEALLYSAVDKVEAIKMGK